MHHRSDIDGLRALAIIPVVLYHAGIPWVSGGFVGVDVFFVISGYLITGIINGEIVASGFSYGRFYERRIRRILPALIFMLVIVGVLSAKYLLPGDFSSFAASVIGSIFFYANFIFYGQSGYFDAPAATKPLLNLWSLAVEEQFYIVFPLLLGLAHRLRGERGIVVAVWAIAVLSLAYSAYAVFNAPSAAFYLLPARAWELMAGALLALNAVPALKHRAAIEGLSLLGLGGVLFGIFGLDHHSLFPGPNALFPVLGAVLLIQYGERSAVGRVLSWPPFVGIGLISYSLYLWHWPVLVLGQYASFVPLDLASKLILVGISIAMAIVSYFVVEGPFRKRVVARRRGTLFVAAAASVALLFGLSQLTLAGNGLPQRLPPDVLKFAAAGADNNPRRDACHGEVEVRPFASNCVYGNADAPPTYALWGDSHAAELVIPLGEMAAKLGQSALEVSNSGCPPALHVDANLRPNCPAQAQADLDGLEASPSIRTVFMISNYKLYPVGPLFAGMREAIGGLQASGKRVVLVYPVPGLDQWGPGALARAAVLHLDPSVISISTASYLDRNRPYLDGLDRLAHEFHLSVVKPSDKICSASRCEAYGGGVSLYFDDNHLSVSGARFISDLLSPYIS